MIWAVFSWSSLALTRWTSFSIMSFMSVPLGAVSSFLMGTTPLSFISLSTTYTLKRSSPTSRPRMWLMASSTSLFSSTDTNSGFMTRAALSSG